MAKYDFDELIKDSYVKNHPLLAGYRGLKKARVSLEKSAQSMSYDDIFTSGKLYGETEAKKDLKAYVYEASMAVNDVLNQFDIPMTPVVRFVGNREIKYAAHDPTQLVSGMLSFDVEFRTVKGVKRVATMMVPIASGEVLTPSVMEIEGRIEVVSQHAIDQVLERASSYQLAPVRQGYEPPLTKAERELAVGARNDMGWEESGGDPKNYLQRKQNKRNKRAQEEAYELGLYITVPLENEEEALQSAVDEIREKTGISVTVENGTDTDEYISFWVLANVSREQLQSIYNLLGASSEKDLQSGANIGDAEAAQILNGKNTGRYIPKFNWDEEFGLKPYKKSNKKRSGLFDSFKKAPSKDVINTSGDEGTYYATDEDRAAWEGAAEGKDLFGRPMKAKKKKSYSQSDWVNDEVKSLMEYWNTGDRSQAAKELMGYMNASSSLGQSVYSIFMRRLPEEDKAELQSYIDDYSKVAKRRKAQEEPMYDISFVLSATEGSVDVEEVDSYANEVIGVPVHASGMEREDGRMFYQYYSSESVDESQLKALKTKLPGEYESKYLSDDIKISGVGYRSVDEDKWRSMSASKRRKASMPSAYELVVKDLEKAAKDGKETFPRSYDYLLRCFILNRVSTASKDQWMIPLINDGWCLNPYGVNVRTRKASCSTWEEFDKRLAQDIEKDVPMKVTAPPKTYDDTQIPVEVTDQVSVKGGPKGHIVEINDKDNTLIIKSQGKEFKVTVSDIEPLAETVKKMDNEPGKGLGKGARKKAQSMNLFDSPEYQEDPGKELTENVLSRNPGQAVEIEIDTNSNAIPETIWVISDTPLDTTVFGESWQKYPADKSRYCLQINIDSLIDADESLTGGDILDKVFEVFPAAEPIQGDFNELVKYIDSVKNYSFSITYDIVTEESAADGDVAESGFEVENETHSVYDIVRDISYSGAENGDSRGNSPSWYGPSEMDYETGDHKSLAYHVSNLGSRDLSKEDLEAINFWIGK